MGIGASLGVRGRVEHGFLRVRSCGRLRVWAGLWRLIPQLPEDKSRWRARSETFDFSSENRILLSDAASGGPDRGRQAGSNKPENAPRPPYSAQVTPLFLQSLALWLLVLHSMAAVVACGSSVHLAVGSLRLLRGKTVRPRSLRIHAATTLAAYVCCGIVGALLYPRYRVLVRGLFLDRCAPWAANLFDFKENLATLGLPMAIGALFLAFSFCFAPGQTLPCDSAASSGPKTDTTADSVAPLVLWIFAMLSVGTAACCVTETVSGLLVTAVRGA